MTTNTEIKRKAFLDLMMDACENEDVKLSDQQLREQVDTIMFGVNV